MNVLIKVIVAAVWFSGFYLVSANPAVAETDEHEELVGIIAAIEEGWEQADGQPFREHYLDFAGVRYFESGSQNAGLDDLIEHHVEPEGEAFDECDLSLTNIETHFDSDCAWARADVELKAVRKRNGEPLDIRGHETFLFRRSGPVWKVVHTHSSSRPVK